MDLHFLRLWDIYNPILTEHQREITDLYFNCDLSLAEIAEQKGCSRQSVSDTLNKARRQMEEWFLRYSDPDLDGRKEGVTGTGQYCRAGSRAHLLEKYGPMPRPVKNE